MTALPIQPTAVPHPQRGSDTQGAPAALVAATPPTTVAAATPAALVEATPLATVAAATPLATLVEATPLATVVAATPAATLVEATPVATVAAATPAATVVAGQRGTAAVASVRDLRPEDVGLIDTLYEQLGPQSRYQRFHGPKPRLSAAERAFMAGPDGRDHVALVALDEAGGPLGVARFVRLRHDPATADIAAEVIDALQHRGIGSDLMARLARRATTLGVQRFTADVLSQSRLRAGLIRRGWRVDSFDGPASTLVVDVWRLLRTPAPAV